MTTVVSASAVCTPGSPLAGWLAIDGGRIVETGNGRVPRGAVDLGDALLAPGYIDLQVNGVDGDDFASAKDDGWHRAARALLAHGVTAYCPTFVSAPLELYAAALDRAAAARAVCAAERLPEILGVHLEGPFLGDAPGAHPVELLRPVDLQFLDRVLDDHPGLLRIVTLAPESDPTLAGTRRLAAAGIVVALGHSRAGYDDARAAADAGARVVTHLFNGMGPLHHRDPGLPGAALDDERLTATLIADLVHVHPAIVRLAVTAKQQLALVSDAVAVESDRLRTDTGAATLADGTLVGAIALLDRAVANVVSLGVPVARAVEMATRIPADVLGLRDRGRLEPGALADLVVLDPQTLHVRAVWLRGEPATSGTETRSSHNGR